MMPSISHEPAFGREPFPPMQPVEEGGRSWKAVYTIVDRGNGRKFWVRIGTAFVNRDQSLNARLDAVPVNGQLHIRDVLPRESLPHFERSNGEAEPESRADGRIEF